MASKGLRILLTGLAVATAGLAAPAIGAAGTQTPTNAAPDPQSIIVNGRNQQETQRRVRSFVDDITRGNTSGQLTRFEYPVCPAAFGLPPEQRALVARRMRTVAQAANMRVAPETCDANVMVVVVADKRAFINALASREPGYFAELEPLQIRRIVAQPGHVSAWQVYGAPLNARGVEMIIDPSLGLYVNRTTEPASRLSAGGRRQFATAVVVVERAALDGLSATQLADYAAMRAYANIYAANGQAYEGDTILNVVDAPATAEVPVTLTQWDLGYLRGLYASAPNLYIGAQRAAIRQGIEQELGIARQ